MQVPLGPPKPAGSSASDDGSEEPKVSSPVIATWFKSTSLVPLARNSPTKALVVAEQQESGNEEAPEEAATETEEPETDLGLLYNLEWQRRHKEVSGALERLDAIRNPVADEESKCVHGEVVELGSDNGEPTITKTKLQSAAAEDAAPAEVVLRSSCIWSSCVTDPGGRGATQGRN